MPQLTRTTPKPTVAVVLAALLTVCVGSTHGAEYASLAECRRLGVEVCTLAHAPDPQLQARIDAAIERDPDVHAAFLRMRADPSTALNALSRRRRYRRGMQLAGAPGAKGARVLNATPTPQPAARTHQPQVRRYQWTNRQGQQRPTQGGNVQRGNANSNGSGGSAEAAARPQLSQPSPSTHTQQQQRPTQQRQSGALCAERVTETNPYAYYQHHDDFLPTAHTPKYPQRTAFAHVECIAENASCLPDGRARCQSVQRRHAIYLYDPSTDQVRTRHVWVPSACSCRYAGTAQQRMLATMLRR